jgi:hypothetical protein
LTVVVNNVPPAPVSDSELPDTVIGTLAGITRYIEHLTALTANSSENEELRLMNDMLEEDNARLREEIGMLKEQAENVCPDPALLRSAAGVIAEEEAGGGRVHGDHPVRR